MNRSMDGEPSFLQGRKPIVRRRFITDSLPDSFLDIQPRLIARQVLDRQPTVGFQEHLDLFAPMPAGTVGIEPDLVSPQSLVKALQTEKEALAIPLGMTVQPRFPQKRRDPAEDIQPHPMLARRWNPKPLTTFGPAHAQPRMKRKARLILKHHGLLRSQIFEFFLRPEKTSGPPQTGLEDRHNCCALDDIPNGASTSGLGGPLALSQTGVSCGRPASVHPSGLGLGRTPAETVPDHFRASSGRSPSVVSVAPAAAAPLRPRLRVHSRHASNYSGSGGLIPKCQ
jgi:hypothetical protein